jgi:ankyrin repeat protein
MDFFDFAQTGNAEKITELLALVKEDERRSFVNQHDHTDKEWTALHWAAFYGKSEVVEILIKNGADVNVIGKFRQSPLHCAVCDNHENIVLRLIESGAHVNQQDSEGLTPLHIAAHGKYINTVIMLILAGADLSLKVESKTAKTVLLLASEAGAMEIVSLLTNFTHDRQQMACTLAYATHTRLAAASPLSLLPQALLKTITELAAHANFKTTSDLLLQQKTCSYAQKIDKDILTKLRH